MNYLWKQDENCLPESNGKEDRNPIQLDKEILRVCKFPKEQHQMPKMNFDTCPSGRYI